MKFDVYFPFKAKDGKMKPGVRPKSLTWAQIIDLMKTSTTRDWINKFRETGDKSLKEQLPAICFTGKCHNDYRENRNMEATQFVFIDIDHVEEPVLAFQQMKEFRGEEWFKENVLTAYVTPSGKGLRIIFLARPNLTTLQDNMEWFRQEFQCDMFGTFDAPCKDFARLSFITKADDLLFVSEKLVSMEEVETKYLENQHFGEGGQQSPKTDEGESKAAENVDNFSDDEKREFDAYEYRGSMLKSIIEKWVEVKGKPGKGEIHNYYNDMVKNFRNICSNNKRCLLYLLPRFGHSAEECWSSIQSICKVNTLSTLPKEFYFFLKDNGFYQRKSSGSLAEYMMSEDDAALQTKMPWLPPVFREYIKITPKDFRPSMVNALLPIMGTLTSYLQAPYYYDGRMHTTTFFSVVYAPPGTGKGFVGRIMNVLFEKLKMRDYVAQAREDIYLQTLNRKSDNEKAPKDPHISLRIIAPKNSEAEFLGKMKDNQGYHMFTFAAEMDSWAKGVRAAGGNKDDMIRMAWDNDVYGQNFKSANTFKGEVALYWNVLITGTIQQLFSYFKNVENGLITRCSFTSIDNQEFAEAPTWKEFNKKDMLVLRKFMERCDDNTYQEPCTLLKEDVDCVEPDKFDSEINWRFQFKKRMTVDMAWLKPTIDNFLRKQMELAARDFDRARDVFRRRVAVRGFRLGLLCYALWDVPRQKDLLKCIPFIEWWMEQDIENELRLWGTRYNAETQESPSIAQKSLFYELPTKFSKTDVFAQCLKMNIKTPIRNIVYQWIKLGYVKKIDQNVWEKTKHESKQ